MVTRFSALCLLLLSPCLQAQTLRVVCGEIAPYCFVENGVGRGYVYEIGQEMLRRMVQPARIEIQPLARSLHNVQNGSQVISLWVGRTPERENTVRWLTPVFSTALSIYTLKGRPDASTIEKARELGVLGATTAGANLAAGQSSGLPRIDTTASEDANGEKLLRGRVNGWITADTTFNYFLLTHQRSADEFVRGVKLADYTAFMAASPDIDDQTARDWARAYQSLRSEGYVQRTMKKYGVVEP